MPVQADFSNKYSALQLIFWFCSRCYFLWHKYYVLKCELQSLRQSSRLTLSLVLQERFRIDLNLFWNLLKVTHPENDLTSMWTWLQLVPAEAFPILSQCHLSITNFIGSVCIVKWHPRDPPSFSLFGQSLWIVHKGICLQFLTYCLWTAPKLEGWNTEDLPILSCHQIWSQHSLWPWPSVRPFRRCQDW